MGDVWGAFRGVVSGVFWEASRGVLECIWGVFGEVFGEVFISFL